MSGVRSLILRGRTLPNRIVEASIVPSRSQLFFSKNQMEDPGQVFRVHIGDRIGHPVDPGYPAVHLTRVNIQCLLGATTSSGGRLECWQGDTWLEMYGHGKLCLLTTTSEYHGGSHRPERQGYVLVDARTEGGDAKFVLSPSSYQSLLTHPSADIRQYALIHLAESVLPTP